MVYGIQNLNGKDTSNSSNLISEVFGLFSKGRVADKANQNDIEDDSRKYLAYKTAAENAEEGSEEQILYQRQADLLRTKLNLG